MMLRISVISVFPDLYRSFLNTSLLARAQENKNVDFDLCSLFSYVEPKERIDAPTFGHGDGMLIKPLVVERAINDQEKRHGRSCRVFFSPHGTTLNQQILGQILEKSQEAGHLMLLPARYEGMDNRVEEAYADFIVSLGDFVLMAGDLPAMVMLEGLIRLIPGVVGKPGSVQEESFNGPFVDYPSYTEPVVWQGKEVPAVIRSGDHAKIDAFRQEQAAVRTIKHHFSWLRSQPISMAQKKVVKRNIPRHYVALMHNQVIVGDGDREGATSVTSIDIHDIARSSQTYGIAKFFLITSLVDQQNIVNTLLDFWLSNAGISYNENRHRAIRDVILKNELVQAIETIQEAEGQKPLIIVTSARDKAAVRDRLISFNDQESVWALGKPILFVFGTGQGLADSVIEQADFILPPIHGFTDFNHLSVRSAAAIVLDRWLGINESSTAIKLLAKQPI